MVLFYHRSASASLVQRICAEEKICVKEVNASMLSGRETQSILFALPNAQIAAVTQLCFRTGCTDVSVLVLDNGYSSNPIHVDVSKPRLNYMETEVARVCNLHCRGCCDFIQLAEQEEPFYDPDAFICDLRQLKTKFWGVEKIRLMGGEPLLNKKTDVYASHTRSVFPDADIRIVTNGILIPTLSAETLAALKKQGVSFDISNYPPTARQRKAIVATLQSAGVAYNFGPPIRCFLKNVSELSSGDPKRAFDNCMFTYCHMMNEGGILSPCSFAYCIRRFNRHFGTDYPETDFVDLYETQQDGWQILQWLSNPHLFCGSCTAGMVPSRWRDGVHRDDASKGDWIIRHNVCTDRVIPFCQRLLLPPANAMRSFIQRKKS